MKKQLTNIETLKAMLNANVLECVECKIYGVQAYNISADEYEVIVKAEKINGRYYFIDRNGRRYLMSRYDRAEFLAGEILENVANAENAARLCAEQVKNHGRAGVHHDVTELFYEACEALGVSVMYCGCHLINGEVYNTYMREPQPTTPAPKAEEVGNEPQTATECANECHRLECRKGGALVEIATGETVGTWGTDEDGFFAQLDGAHPYNYVHIVNDPTEGTETATEGENEPQSDRNAATAELFAVSLEVVECLRDIETLTPEEAADKYPAGLLAQAEQLGQLEEWAEQSNPRFDRDHPTGTRAEMVETLQRFNPDTMARAAV